MAGTRKADNDRLSTGSGDPTADTGSDVIFGGDPFGDDLGFGPARLLSVEGVSQVAQFLSNLDPETVRGRMDRAAMQRAGLYPSIWNEEDVLDDFLLPALERLRTFYAAAAKADEAVIQTLC